MRAVSPPHWVAVSLAAPARTGRRPRHLPLFHLGVAAELAWALFGSLVLGLGRRPQPEPAACWLWLGGAVLLALALLALGLLQRHPGQRAPGG